MPDSLVQVGDNENAWQALIKNHHDRIDAVRLSIETLGGKVKEGYVACAGGGAWKGIETTPLMSSAEAVEAMKTASRSGDRAAT